jgi:hypothetical protein
VVHCFEVRVEPALGAAAAQPRAALELLEAESELRAGRPARVRLRLVDPRTGAPHGGLPDVTLLAVQPPGVWQQRAPARPVAGREGVYEAEMSFESAALHYFFVEIRSLGLGLNRVPFVTGMVAAAPASGKEPQ